MDVRLNLDLNFTAGLWNEDQFYMNNYLVNINLVTNSLEPEDAQVAVERLRWFAHNVLNHSFFVKQDELDRQHQLWANGLNVVVLPEHPTDQIVGMMLYTKLNAITDNKVIITDIQIASSMSDGVRYVFAEDDNYGIFGEDNWWNDKEIIWFDKTILKEPIEDGTVKMQPIAHWQDVDLHWKEETPSGDGNVVVGNFKKDD